MSLEQELIDTLWNVNEYVTLGRQMVHRINRYIMECKCRLDRTITTDWIELIDTLWNVNTEEFSEDVQTETGINRYIMECK